MKSRKGSGFKHSQALLKHRKEESNTVFKMKKRKMAGGVRKREVKTHLLKIMEYRSWAIVRK
ncbi:MAG: hypothetical protein Q4B71_06335, partial [Cardiobacteriaceae bacterium]|nr:hypothetical protein [Cardiobacteriaceae bacterium]